MKLPPSDVILNLGNSVIEIVQHLFLKPQAVSPVKTTGSILSHSQVTPHLTHRPLIKLAQQGSELVELTQFEYIFLNLRHPGFASTQQVTTRLLERLKKRLNLN